jgi:Putative phage abortive infection protein
MTQENNSKTDDDNVYKRLSKAPLGLGIFAFCLAAVYIGKFYSFPWSTEPDAWGTFGDYIGGLLNPLISLFTLVVAVSVWRLNREALDTQKQELKATKEALEEQAKTSERQRREQRFFDALRLYQETVNSIQLENYESEGAISYSGKRVFSFIANSQGIATRRVIIQAALGPTLKDFTQIIAGEGGKQKVIHILESWSALLDHYFRIIFLILGEAEKTLGDDRYKYIKYLRAQLNKDELQLLTLNMLFDFEGKKMIALAAEYGLLKHLPNSQLRTYAQIMLPAGVFGRKWIAMKKQFARLAPPGK